MAAHSIADLENICTKDSIGRNAITASAHFAALCRDVVGLPVTSELLEFFALMRNAQLRDDAAQLHETWSELFPGTPFFWAMLAKAAAQPQTRPSWVAPLHGSVSTAHCVVYNQPNGVCNKTHTNPVHAQQAHWCLCCGSRSHKLGAFDFDTGAQCPVWRNISEELELVLARIAFLSEQLSHCIFLMNADDYPPEATGEDDKPLAVCDLDDMERLANDRRTPVPGAKWRPSFLIALELRATPPPSATLKMTLAQLKAQLNYHAGALFALAEVARNSMQRSGASKSLSVWSELNLSAAPPLLWGLFAARQMAMATTKPYPCLFFNFSSVDGCKKWDDIAHKNTQHYCMMCGSASHGLGCRDLQRSAANSSCRAWKEIAGQFAWLVDKSPFVFPQGPENLLRFLGFSNESTAPSANDTILVMLRETPKTEAAKRSLESLVQERLESRNANYFGTPKKKKQPVTAAGAASGDGAPHAGAADAAATAAAGDTASGGDASGGDASDGVNDGDDGAATAAAAAAAGSPVLASDDGATATTSSNDAVETTPAVGKTPSSNLRASAAAAAVIVRPIERDAAEMERIFVARRGPHESGRIGRHFNDKTGETTLWCDYHLCGACNLSVSARHHVTRGVFFPAQGFKEPKDVVVKRYNQPTKNKQDNSASQGVVVEQDAVFAFDRECRALDKVSSLYVTSFLTVNPAAGTSGLCAVMLACKSSLHDWLLESAKRDSGDSGGAAAAAAAAGAPAAASGAAATGVAASGIPSVKHLEFARNLVANLLYVYDNDMLTHGDLKPQNCILRGDGGAGAQSSRSHAVGGDRRSALGCGSLEFIDFEFARLIEATGVAKTIASSTKAIGATDAWTSPEQLISRRPSAASDCWSLALLLYEVLSNRPRTASETCDGTLLPLFFCDETRAYETDVQAELKVKRSELLAISAVLNRATGAKLREFTLNLPRALFEKRAGKPLADKQTDLTVVQKYFNQIVAQILSGDDAARAGEVVPPEERVVAEDLPPLIEQLRPQRCGDLLWSLLHPLLSASIDNKIVAALRDGGCTKCTEVVTDTVLAPLQRSHILLCEPASLAHGILRLLQVAMHKHAEAVENRFIRSLCGSRGPFRFFKDLPAEIVNSANYARWNAWVRTGAGQDLSSEEEEEYRSAWEAAGWRAEKVADPAAKACAFQPFDHCFMVRDGFTALKTIRNLVAHPDLGPRRLMLLLINRCDELFSRLQTSINTFGVTLRDDFGSNEDSTEDFFHFPQ